MRARAVPGNADPVAVERRVDACVKAANQWFESDHLHELIDLVAAATVQPDRSAIDPDRPYLDEDLPTWVAACTGSVDSETPVPQPLRYMLDHALQTEHRAAELFNFRMSASGSYRERSQAVGADFTTALRARVFEVCSQLGLVEPSLPRRDSYDYTLILGGGYRSGMLRATYAATLQSRINLGRIYLLGSPRFLLDDPARPEADEVADFAPEATDEYDLMAAAASRLSVNVAPTRFLCGCAGPTGTCPRWDGVGHLDGALTPAAYTHERVAPLFGASGHEVGAVLSASTGRPPYRPNTADTLDLWARYAEAQSTEQVLLVTTQVFVPFQRFDALRELHLEQGLEVETVGFGDELADRPLTAEYLLQEALSATRSARRLLIAAIEAGWIRKRVSV